MFKSKELIRIISQNYMNSTTFDKLSQAAPFILALCFGSAITGMGLVLMQKSLNNDEAAFCAKAGSARMLIDSHSVVGTVKQCFPIHAQSN
jgi:hypothetical protein